MPNPKVDQVLAALERRTFLTQLCAGGLLCVGCSRAAAAQQPVASQLPTAATRGPAHKFVADSKMTFEQVFGFTYGGVLIPLLDALADEIGRGKFLPMLQEVASRASANSARKIAPPRPKNTLAALHPPPDYFWSHVLASEWIEKTEKAAETRVTECLWAKTFRAARASDIGYAIICHPDFAFASAFNPKIRMTRTKTLMQGHDCCNHRWVVEA